MKARKTCVCKVEFEIGAFFFGDLFLLILLIREGIQKKSIFLGKSPKLWVGGGQES